MAAKYLHQQLGIVPLLVALVIATVVYVAFATAGAQIIGLLVLLLVIVVSFLFGSLTVGVDQKTVHLRFGAGLIKRSWAVRDIASAEAVRNPWYTGWGIRYLPGVTVYNVSGFDAVEITLHNGKRYRIGTNDPGGLESAIRARLRP